MPESKQLADCAAAVAGTCPAQPLVQLPTPIHRLANFGAHLDGPDLWIKRDDLTGLVGGGNKSRKLEFLVGDALRSGAETTLVTVGGDPVEPHPADGGGRGQVRVAMRFVALRLDQGCRS